MYWHFLFFQDIYILTGDVDQLQSVGAGDVFRELIDSGLIPVTVLNEIFRQKKGSLIAYNAKRINEANIDLQYGEDFQFVKCQTQEEAADLICRLFCEQVALHGIEKVQILSPFRSEGPASVEQLNAAIRELVNPARDEFADLKVGSHYFRVGDKVMQTKNNAKASNGDIIHEWFSLEENRILWEELKPMVNIEKKETNMSVVQDNPFVGKTLVVTGKVEPYTRDGINAKIYSLGAKAGSSVSKNTDYLICGENAGSKLAKAQALGVAVLSPAEFFRMIGE